MTASKRLRGYGHAVLAASAIAATVLPAATAALAAGEVNIYSYREPKLIAPLLQAFTKANGIKVNIIFAKNGLIERMKAEGRNSPADVLLTNEFGLLVQAAEAGVVQPVKDAALNKRIAAAYRDPDGQWFGLTRRARVVYASKARVKQDAITYEELADPKWKGRICIRSGQYPYNTGLFSAMLAHMGKEKAEAWLRGLKANLARKPSGNDRLQVKGVYAGECDLAIANTYYMAAMMLNKKQPEQQQWAASVKMLFPNAAGRGTHVNISGMALAKNAPHKAEALKLMTYLASDNAQKLYAGVNHEYPIVDNVPASDLVKSWGTLKADQLDLATMAKLRKAASKLVDEVNFNAGPSS